MRLMVILLVCLFQTGFVWAQDQVEADNTDADAERAIQAIETIRDLVENRIALASELGELTAIADEDGAEAREERIAEIKASLKDIERQIGAVATGVSDAEYGITDENAFDLNAEMQALVEPFVAMMRDATENARQIERLRRDLAEAKRRQALAERALETLAPVRARAASEEVIESVDARRKTWEGRANAAGDLVNALEQQLEDRLSDRGATQQAAGQAASNFVRERGVSLALGLGAFALVFGALRLLRRAATWVREKRRVKRSLYTRLANLVFTAFTPVAAVGAMLAVFNARNDWLLLGVFAVMLLALMWIGIKMLPEMVDQVTLLLNLGAVQEGERVIFADTPYRVRRLDFYTDLENPVLEGAEFTLPIKDLIGLHSRPSGADEPWFPTRKGDWVRLADETFGQIVSQSPELVEIEIPGGSRLTYTTGDFLAEKPDNLSGGYRAEITFGISYDLQAQSTNEVIAKLIAYVRQGLIGLVSAEQLRDVGVELLEAADSAIVYEVEADLTGDAAYLMEDVERAIARLCIDACTEYGWEIPFPQMVVHRK